MSGPNVSFEPAIVVLSAVPTYTTYHVVRPMLGMRAPKRIVLDAIPVMILAAIASFMHHRAI